MVEGAVKYSIFSVVTGTSMCTVPFKVNERNKDIPQGCQFCVSGEYGKADNRSVQPVNERNFKKAMRLALNSNVDTVILTGRGEPTLFPDQITEYLTLCDNQFVFTELQTNGVPLGLNYRKYESYLRQWYELGLTTILISVVSDDPEILRQNYMPRSTSYYDLPDLIRRLRGIGFTVRLACVCTKPWMSTIPQLESFLRFARENNVGQVTLRPVNDEFRRESARLWIEENKLTEEDKEDFHVYLSENGHVLHDIVNVGTVYDYQGVSVMLSVPLTRDTSHNSDSLARNLIFFPNGEVRYDWEKEGAILLQGDDRELTVRDGLKL